MNSRHAALIEEVRRRAPETQGVYLLRGDKEILYVGKAVNLRQRILSHLRPDPMTDMQRHSRMVFEVRGFDFQLTPSELLALLLEDDLIKRHAPRYNVRQNEFLEYKYLERTSDPYPRLRMVDHSPDAGSRRLFGPYRDRYLAIDLQELVHNYLGLRSCTGANPVDQCLDFDLGKCSGPCRKAISPAAYARVVAEAEAFLAGDPEEITARLQEAMQSSSMRMEFEKAQELKDRIEFCRRFADRQRFFTAFRERMLTVVEEGPPDRSYVFVQGYLEWHGAESAPPRSSDPIPAIDLRFLYDRAAIVHSWLRRNSGRSTHSFSDS